MRRPKYQELARLATNAAKARGHDLGVWTFGGMWQPGRSVTGRVTGSARCQECKAEATIDNGAEVGGIAIAGLALALDCAKVPV
jgi:hypothetical protein